MTQNQTVSAPSVSRAVIRQVMSALARRKSPARAAASKSNGLKGGHPFLCLTCRRSLRRVWPKGLPVTEDSICRHECRFCKTSFSEDELKKKQPMADKKSRSLPVNKRSKRAK